MTYTLIAHQELTSTQASITFSSIPATFTDLYLVFSVRGTGNSGGNNQLDIYGGFNGQGFNTNISVRSLFGTGSSVISDTWNGFSFGLGAGVSSTANTFGSSSVYIPNYRSSAAKSFSVDAVSEQNATGSFQLIGARLWNQTAAITSITLGSPDGSFVSGSSATLFGITAGTTPGVVVS